MRTVKRPRKIQALLYALALMAVSFALVRSDMRCTSADDGGRTLQFSRLEGFITPSGSDNAEDSRGSCNIYADTPQVSVPRNTSVSSQPRQQTTAKRTGSSGFTEATLKDGKLITRYTFHQFYSIIRLFPSGQLDAKTRLLSYRKLII